MHENCNPDNCPVNARVDALGKEFDRYRDNSSSTHEQMFRRIGDLEQNGAAVKATLESMDEKLDKVVEWQEAQQSKPAKRWDGLIDKAIWAVAAAVIAFLLAKVGL